MKNTTDNIADVLERIFHEPNRLAIMSALCGSRAGLTFNELKDVCRLTDGNLNRHLKVLEEAGVVRVTKEFVKAKPRTTLHLSDVGLERFNQYLSALSEVVERARRAMPESATSVAGPAVLPNPVKA
jgi:DNA-binding transcriptional ArsR family regulator